jgi:predicted  nucleic acid-binding Zn-ribbon protein
MTDQIPTPRTDAICIDLYDDVESPHHKSITGFARQLEVELLTAQSRIGRLEHILASAPYRCECATDDVCAMAKRIAELERDLAWLRDTSELAENVFSETGGQVIVWQAVCDHLDSKPPEDWNP